MRRSSWLSISALLFAVAAHADLAKESVGAHTVYVYAPAGLAADKPAPLLLLFHGSGRDGMSQINEWRALADAEGVVLAAPDALNPRRWSVPDDGPELLRDVIDFVAGKHAVDRRRVYAFGHSNGALFALSMAPLESNLLAAVAVHAGHFKNAAATGALTLAERKIPMFIAIGTKDQYFSLDDVRQTRALFSGAGFPIETREIPDHDHDYYAVSAQVNAMAWDFLAPKRLAGEPRYRAYRVDKNGDAMTFAPLDMAGQVRAELLHAWRGYEQYAWGHDELRPLSRTARDWHGAESLLMTPVDSLDTLLIMGLDDEAAKAKQLIIDRLSFDKDIEVKNFEITIRILGGLLTAYQMTHDERLLKLADDLGARLLPVFDSPTGMPYMYVNLKTGKTRGARSNPAEIGTLVLEFGTLARLTHKPVYFDKAKNALVQLYKRRSKLDLVGEEIDVETGQWVSPQSHVGGGIDSYYEYVLKCAKLFGDKDCQAMWTTHIRALNKYLADQAPSGFWYGQVDMNSGARTASEFGALHAFLPAVLVLGGDVKRARRLEESCFKMWNLAGIEPEVLDYREMKITHPGYQLRPEIVESAYYLWRATHDPRYREMGRVFFDALVKYCRTDAGYTTLKSVVTKEQGDLQHSFLLAETMKYLYLLFSPDRELGVFNTEAHPLR